VADPVPDEGGGERVVVEEATLLQAVQDRIDVLGPESLGEQSAPQLGPRAGAVGEEGERRLPDGYLGVRVQEGRSPAPGKGVAHAEARTLERFESHLQRVPDIEMDADTQSSRPERFHACDEGIGVHVTAPGSPAFLGIPMPVPQVVEEGDGSAVVQDDRTVFAGDRGAPPFVVDPPGFPHGVDLAGRLAGKAHEGGFPSLVGPDLDAERSVEGAESGGIAHGSKLSRA